jgi:uncharacterized SAM-binding protein YcdF (DUF218 family)
VDSLAQISKSFIPGSLWFLLATATLALGLLCGPGRRSRIAGRLLLALVVGAYWVASVPAVADAVQRGYPPVAAPPVIADGHDSGIALVVLGAGLRTYRSGGQEIAVPTAQSAFNVLRGGQLYREMGEPLVIVSGGIADASVQRAREADVLAALLRDAGVPEERLVLERKSNTTYTPAGHVAGIARARGIRELLVITSPAHLRRTIPAFRAQGVSAAGYPADFVSERRLPVRQWVPAPFSADVTRDAMYDYVAWFYYWGQGRLTP